jgi:hypothetical protein
MILLAEQLMSLVAEKRINPVVGYQMSLVAEQWMILLAGQLMSLNAASLWIGKLSDQNNLAMFLQVVLLSCKLQFNFCYFL